MPRHAPLCLPPAALAFVPVLVLVLAASPGQAQQAAVRGGEAPGSQCGPIYTAHYGPYDYRTQRPSLKVVEDFHYTPPVQAALGGATGPFGGDINYTLRASPNHHRALMSLVRWTERMKTDQTRGMEWPVECYFDRAIRFKPDDTVVRVLYAQFLHQRKRTADALRQLDAGVEHAGDNAFSHYNIGLMYLEIGSPEKALQQAHKAIAMGFPRQELAEQLKRAGQWQEPAAPQAALAVEAAASAASAAAAAAAAPAASAVGG